ncbi:MAG: U32 family peptidase [Bacteroidales bacterium]|nr:U32 family peptidase [Bacteroidales bacterium]
MHTQERQIEIMAPVGSFEALTAAIQAGANAVYFGIGDLNMRSRSSINFTEQDLHTISQTCKANNVKTYLTINTIIYDDELPKMKHLVDLAKENGITAIIASDLSVIQYAKQKNVEVHISTQCNITNIEAVRFFAQYADVMVTARELSLKQVKKIITEIKEQNICGPSGNLVKIEIFAHGALCMAVSGKCYLSLHNFGYSANRGACLQPCRRAYTVYDTDNEVSAIVDEKYIMSPKDLCTIGFLDKIVEAGVSVLKIEGRGRSPEYVKTVTTCYREAATAVLDGSYSETKVKQWTQQLENVYNRGFWDGYYLGRKLGEWTERYGSQAKKVKVYIGKITNYFSKLKVAEIKVEANNLNKNDDLLIIGPTSGVVESKPEEIRVDLQPVATVEKGIFCSVPCSETVRRNDKVYKLVSACDSDDYEL